MKNHITLLTLFLSITLLAQKIDYNTDDKGFLVKGYDVVSFFTEKEPVKGSDKFIATYNDVNFKFATKKNKDLFISNPTKYMPEYGGYCAYAIAEKKIKMDVNPKKYEIRDGKLYLFYSSWITDRLEDWQEGNTKVLQQKGDKNWQEMQYKN